MKIETAIREIHQVELTSTCNLRCPYCIHGNPGAMKRPVQHMTPETWGHVLAALKRLCDAGTQGELNLAGIGESTLHPMFTAWMLQAREVIGPHRKIVLATNGTEITPQIVEAIKDARPEVWVSLHQPARAEYAIRLLRAAGILAGVSADGAVNPNDWAGQVNWVPAAYRVACPWIAAGWGMVASDGGVLSCCLDASGISRVGSIALGIAGLKVRTSRLCRKCYQMIDIPGFDQTEAD